MTTANTAPKTVMQRLLDGVERVGNMVPHPVIIFLILIGIVIVLSAILGAFGAAVSFERINPDTHEIETASTEIRSLLNVEGIRFLYASLIPNFMSFTAVGLMIAAMIGAGVAEESGLVTALIRKLVIVSPRWALTYILAFVGILASIAADAGYLVLIPLAGVAYMAVGRHPLAGLALGFAAVAGAFTVNMLIKPLDAVLVEFTNDAARLVDPARSIGLASNVWFSIASVIFLTFIIAFITDRMISPRLGEYKPEASADGAVPDQGAVLSEQESRGLRFALYGLIGLLVVFLLLTLPSGAPLRNPETGELIGNSPFMNGLIALIMLMFLVTGWTYGIGAGTLRTLSEVIAAIEKSIKNMGGTIFLFFVLSQFVSYFTYTNIGTVMALSLSGALQAANIGALPLLIGFIVVVAIIDLLLTGAIAKWAIFAPVFVPLLMKLGVEPEAVLAAYRVGDSPMNAITPLNAYFALVVGFAQKYDKSAGVGTIVSLMLPYVVLMFVLWTALFAVWKALGLPWGL
ncbi:aminobenzoyl-glutamate transport protein [Phyllobacterium trifolii]|jgi:aminobenzoyl-glutamate transport protein|uniref:Aminobenzoyl-glutamate transport protein n=1 Tax=Phyllobacterium trifolii TaxID=300193 RepID=A0A839UCB9_9HYPH|nr:AbgT family transporter [Phyllobacterium trifolii]MBB3146331.1 aminobenzoyl-glutamate transport protein [Phyllobacterium trifolii]